MSDTVQFKQFSLNQDQCAMKVGTDGVLLGAWVNLFSDTRRILDVGSGTGLIALMLAQRAAHSEIDGIEQDAKAYEQGVDNFLNSPWDQNLFNFHGTFQEFAREGERCYDLIVCNPPFFNQGQMDKHDQRSMARNAKALPIDAIAKGALNLLIPAGRLAMILPHDDKQSVMSLLESHGMGILRMTSVRGNETKPPKRLLIEAGLRTEINTSIPAELSELVIEHSRHNYTEQFCDLVREFYLKI